MKENIEEDIKIVEKLIKTMEQDRITFKDEQTKEIYAYFITALEHILSDYKRVLKENEELKETNKVISIELTKDKILQQDCLRTVCGMPIGEIPKIIKENEELKDKWDKDTHKLQNDLDIANAKRIDWEKAYQEEKDKQFELIQNTNNTIKTANIAIKDLQEKLKEVISVQKVKDKIEELEKKRIKMEKDDIGVGFTLGREWSDLKSKIEAYEDLVEEKGE